MSIFGIFDIGKSALYANQLALNVVSNNIANVNTPGYNRQGVVMVSADPVQIRGDFVGRGIGDVDVKRHYDNFIFLQIIGQKQSYGLSDAMYDALSKIEQIFNEAQDIGLANVLSDYFNAWQDVATNPEGEAQRAALLEKSNALLQTAQQMESDIVETLEGVNNEIADVVTDINNLTSQIAEMNEKIVQVEAGLSQEEASYLRDQRDQLLTELGELVDFTSYEDDNGAVTILVAGKSLVNNDRSYNLTTSVDLEGNRHVYYGSDDITDFINQGKLGGLIAVRSDISDNVLFNLRRMIASLIKETNLIHENGYGLDGSTGNNFFGNLQIYYRNYSQAGYVSSATITDLSSLTLDEYEIRFTSDTDYEVYNLQTGSVVTSGTYTPGGNISFDGINVVIDGSPVQGDKFFISPLTGVIEDASVAITDTEKIAAASSSSDLPGDNTNALQLAQLSQQEIDDLGSSTYEDYYNGLVSTVGIMSESAYDSLIYDDNMLNELEMKRQEVSGVNLDEEAVNLIMYQRAYEAAAKIIQVADELMETIVNL